MKKENRKLAQQRRAEERKKQERQRKIKKFLTYFLPSVCVLALAIVIIWDGVQNSVKAETTTEESSSDTSSGTEADSTATEDSDTGSEDSADTSATTEDSPSPVLSTDTSLTVQDGDSVNIDYVGSIDGVEFDSGSTNGAGTTLVIGSGSYIDDFEEQLIGSHPGDTVDVNVTFPENYGNEELNGKDALFKVTINGIYEN